MRDRHAAFYLALAERGGEIDVTVPPAWLDAAERDHDNLRAALHWFGRRGAHDQALALVARLFWLWYLRGHMAEGLARHREVLGAAGAAAHTPAGASVLKQAGVLARYAGDPAQARAYVEASLAVAEALGDPVRRVKSLSYLGGLAQHEGDFATARALQEQALVLLRRAGGGARPRRRPTGCPRRSPGCSTSCPRRSPGWARRRQRAGCRRRRWRCGAPSARSSRWAGRSSTWATWPWTGATSPRRGAPTRSASPAPVAPSRRRCSRARWRAAPRRLRGRAGRARPAPAGSGGRAARDERRGQRPREPGAGAAHRSGSGGARGAAARRAAEALSPASGAFPGPFRLGPDERAALLATARVRLDGSAFERLRAEGQAMTLEQAVAYALAAPPAAA